MKKIKLISIYLFSLIAFMACSKEDEGPQFGKLEIKFDNVVGTTSVELNTENEPYTNSAGETYNISTLRYYISNVRLQRADGSYYEDRMSPDGSKGYYLIDESEASSKRITLDSVPAGNYTHLIFTIGVDANQVEEGAQTGVLDPVKGMFWSWNSGYIFVMLEGTSSFSSDSANYIVYHVGGYKSDPAIPSLADNIRVKTMPIIGDAASVSATRTPSLHIIVDVNKFFEAPNQIKFSETPVQHSPAANVKVSENYLNTFVLDHVHN